jgi:hypothetical protein
MKILAHPRTQVLWLRAQLPLALLVALLQRTPIVRVAAVAEELVIASPLGAVLRSTVAAVASLGALHTLAGATTFFSASSGGTVSNPGPLSLKVGTQVPLIAFGVNDTINIASWKIGGTLPPGVQLASQQGGDPLSGPGKLQAPVTMTGDPNDPYGGGAVGTTTTTPFLTGTPTTAGTYTVTFQAWEFADLTGLSTNTFSYQINVAADTTNTNVAPAISAQPQTQTVAAGATVTFSITVTGTPTPTVVWNKNGSAISGATGTTLTLPSVSATVPSDSATDAGTYTAVATNAAGAVTSNAATLTVSTPATTAPSVASQPGAQTIAAGSTVVFNVGATGSGALTYQWRKDGADLAGATGATLILSNATVAQAGAYSVVVRNSAGTATSNTAALTVSTVPPPPSAGSSTFPSSPSPAPAPRRSPSARPSAARAPAARSRS